METSAIPLNRLYGDLAYLWPLFSPPEEYAEEAGFWRRLLRELAGPGRHRVLELGVGGGHNLSHLAGEFEATAVDLSPTMLELSRRKITSRYPSTIDSAKKLPFRLTLWIAKRP